MSGSSSNSTPAVRILSNTADLGDAVRKAKQEPKKLLVMEFMAPWSEPSKFMRSVYESVANAHRADAHFCALDFDSFKPLAKRLRVEALPTFLIVKENYVEDRVIGLSKEELEASINKHKYKSERE